MRIKESIRDAVRKDSKDSGDVKGMTPEDKIKIIAYHLSGYPIKTISGIMGFSMDWLRAVIDALATNREFREHALKLNISKYSGKAEEGGEDIPEKKEKHLPTGFITQPLFPKEVLAKPISESNLLDDLGIGEDIETSAPVPKRRGRPPGSKNKK